METVTSLMEMMLVPHFVGQSRIETVTKAVPQPGPGQLLIRVRANALCGSERGQFVHGSRVTPGHEAAGVVAAAGPETRTPVGTAGAIFLMDYCGECRSCRQGFTNQCLQKRADMGFSHDGGYGAYELIHENIFFPIGQNVTPTEATLLLDIMGTGGHALARGQLVRPDIESLYIAGAGPIGLGTLAMAKILYGDEFPVLISDMVPYRLALAERLGGRPIHLGEQTPQAGLQAHGCEAVDLAIDTSGKRAARRGCMDVLGKRGALICVGHGEGLDLTISPDLIAPERAVLGSEYFCYHELPANLQRLHRHRDYLNEIITHRYGVAEIQEAFETFFAGNTGKVIIEQ
jgi:threonine dehydrogenase-like Zn-dependent dehydrogenase